MPPSILSSDSLSSPSPSPDPEDTKTPTRTRDRDRRPPLDDDDSELSDLTEEEPEDGNNAPRNSRTDEQGEDDDEGQDDDQDEDEDEEERRPSLRRGGRRKRGGMVPAPMWDWAYKAKKAGDEKSASATVEEEEEEEEEIAGPPRQEEEEDEEVEEDDETGLIPNTERPRDGFSRRKRPTSALDNDNEDGYSSDGSVATLDRRRRRRREEEEDVSDTGADRVKTRPQAASSDAEENNESEDEDEKAKLISSAAIGEAVETMLGLANSGDVDVESTQPTIITPAAAASSSIMAGSTVLPDPEEEDASRSPSLSRSASPVPSRYTIDSSKLVAGRLDDAKLGNASDKKTKAIIKSSVTTTEISVIPVSVASTTLAISATAAAPAAPAEDQDPDLDPMDIDLDIDLQPAHRAEALDVLATIELKFALLRERVYVEKMEALAWEEGLVSVGEHSSTFS